MKQAFDFANLSNDQKIKLMRQIEFKKHAWLEVVYRGLVDTGEMPKDIYDAAHSNEPDKQKRNHEINRAKEWLETQGFELIDIWEGEDTGAVLKRREKIIAKLEIEIDHRAILPSFGNKPSDNGD